jgi:uncharacterized protein (DUF1697 family)
MKEKYVAFLRGINVGGHHKVPMADLRAEMEKLGFEHVKTLLNSGNIVFESDSKDLEKLERTITEHLENVFGFPIPTILRKSELIQKLISSAPFKKIEVTEDTRLYVSFIRQDTQTGLPTPWISEDSSFKIIGIIDKMILSVLDISVTKTPKAMEVLGKHFGSDITTRNWKTIEKVGLKL